MHLCYKEANENVPKNPVHKYLCKVQQGALTF